MKIPQAVGKCVCIIPDATLVTMKRDGIILTPEMSKTTNRKATVINVGSEVKEVKSGDSVYIRMYVSTTNNVSTEDVPEQFYVIHEQEILSKFVEASPEAESLVNGIVELNRKAKEDSENRVAAEIPKLVLAR
jgi:co-chaperonin GroES (HSP10)